MKRHILIFFCILGGTTLAGLLWLFIYNTRYTSDIGVDQIAAVTLLFALIGGGLLTLATVLIMMRKHFLWHHGLTGMLSVVAAVAIVGYPIGLYAEAHYDPFCDNHPGMCSGV